MSVHRYRLSGFVIKDNNKRVQLRKWLQEDPGRGFLEMNKVSFEAVVMLTDTDGRFSYEGPRTIAVSENNTHYISRLLGAIFTGQWTKKFSSYNGFFILKENNKGDFIYRKGFIFNIEVFPDGRFLVHFTYRSAVSLVSRNVFELISMVKKTSDSVAKDHFVILYDKASGKKITIKPCGDDAVAMANRFTKQYPEYEINLDYRFLAFYFPTQMGFASGYHKNRIYTVEDLKSASQAMDDFTGIRLYKQDHLAINPEKIMPAANLKVGKNEIVQKLSQTYHSGIYLPARGYTVVPLVARKIYTRWEQVRILMEKNFNKHGDLIMHAPIFIDDIKDVAATSKEIASVSEKVFVLVITSDILHNDFIASLQKARLKYQIGRGLTDNFSLSNFVVKCLTKMKGKVALIATSQVSQDAYFIGFDMGHRHGNPGLQKNSSMAGVLADAYGQIIDTYRINDLQLNEAINKEAFSCMLAAFRSKLISQKRSMPSQLIYHRDGKMHKGDKEHILQVTEECFGLEPEKTDIVEIIKSGYPYMYAMEGLKAVNPGAGLSWKLEKYRYALLVSTDQGSGSGELLNPIVIKHRHGSLPLGVIVSQIFWLCKMYSNNIYYPTRLPLTIEQSNNRAGTGSKKYQASYLSGMD